MAYALKEWLDDFAVHAPTEGQLLQELRSFITTCRQKNFKISLTKSTFFSRTLHWCGRVIDENGVRLDSRRLSGLVNVSQLETAAELCEFVQYVTWMSPDIPYFSERIAPLRALLEEDHRKSKSRTNRSISKYTVMFLGWGHEHESAFESLQEQLQTFVKVSHCDPEWELCIFTDSSDRYWASVATKCELREL